jgi:hypothetical protein
MRGDGFVQVSSALGRNRNASLELGFPDQHRWVGFGMGHLDLLSRVEVYEKIRSWLADVVSPARGGCGRNEANRGRRAATGVQPGRTFVANIYATTPRA